MTTCHTIYYFIQFPTEIYTRTFLPSPSSTSPSSTPPTFLSPSPPPPSLLDAASTPMAYSNLFKSGLLSESSSPLYLSEPWARDYLGPRRGSPHDDDDDDDNVQSSPMPSLPSTSQTPESLSTQDSSFYFSSNKKRRNPVEFRSFLSLDLAESQSLRSASVKGKTSFEAINSIRSRKAATSLFDSNTTMSYVYCPLAFPLLLLISSYKINSKALSASIISSWQS